MQEEWNEDERAGFDAERVEGRVRGRVIIAQQLVQMGFDKDTVCKVLGLTAAEIETLHRILNSQ